MIGLTLVLTAVFASAMALPLIVKSRIAKGKATSEKDLDPFTNFWMNFMTGREVDRGR